MRAYLLLSALLLSTACHHSNTTSTDPSVRKMPFDNTAFLSIPHSEEQSILRRKLLNEALTDELKKANKSELSQVVKIDDGDQFKFVNDSYKLSKITLEEYKRMKANAAEVIVSYNDRLEIYFVPTGIRRDKAFDQLGLLTDIDSNSYWVETPDAYLFKNKTYYLVNASRKEMKENDVYFNHSESAIGSDFNDKILSYDRNQIIELKINADYFVKETSYVEMKRTGPAPSRRSCDWEAGTCGSQVCTFKMEAPTGGLLRSKLTNSELVDLDIVINGRSYPLIELKPKIDQEGNFLVMLDLKKMVNTDMASIEFRQNPQYPVAKNVSGVEYSGSCNNGNDNRVIDITPLLKINLDAMVLGRKLSGF
jgi:hypothetical protein